MNGKKYLANNRMNRSAICTGAYNNTISTYGDFPLEVIRAEKQRRGYGDSAGLMGSGFGEAQIKEAVLASFASREQAKCNRNPSAYQLYGGKRKRTRKNKKSNRKNKKSRRNIN
jgi:hypothetical protein